MSNASPLFELGSPALSIAIEALVAALPEAMSGLTKQVEAFEKRYQWRERAFFYHGSNDEHWGPGAPTAGLFGNGVYLTSREEAALYGHHVFEVEAKIEKPFFCRAQYVDETGLDSPALFPLLLVLGLEGLENYIAADRYELPSAFTHQLSRAGYDSVIALYDDANFEICVFDASALQSSRNISKP